MSTVQSSEPRVNSWLGSVPVKLPGRSVGWLEERRVQARTRLNEQGYPGPKDEAWRYTNLQPLLEQGFAVAAGEISAIEESDLAGVLIGGLHADRVVLVNGRLMPGLSRLGALPPGVRVGSLREILEQEPNRVRDYLAPEVAEDRNPFSALNTVAMDDGMVLMLSEGVSLERPIELLHISAGPDEPRLAQPRHLIVMGEGAEAAVLERYVSLHEGLYCNNLVLEIHLGEGARLEHQRVQEESPRAFHLSGLYLQQAAGSIYRGTNIALGASWSRTELHVRFGGAGAQCELDGLYLAGDRQLVDFHLDVSHEVPSCSSRESFKGILYGRGRAVFDGRIYVHRDAQKTDAHLSNANLFLSRNAEVDAKPQLEINADDVKCSHGTTVGQIEPSMLFYLRARGIPEPKAREMLCLGFAEEIIEGCGPEAVRTHLSAAVAQRLRGIEA